MRKLKRKTGETIAEALVAVLIMAFAFLILTGAVGAAARVNESIKNDVEAFQVENVTKAETAKFEVGFSVFQNDLFSSGVLVEAGSAKAALHYESDGYYYYE